MFVTDIPEHFLQGSGNMFFVRASKKNYHAIFAASWLWSAPFEIKQVFFKLRTLLGKKTPKKITAP